MGIVVGPSTLYADWQQRAPGSVKVRTGGNSPRPACAPTASRGQELKRLSRWKSGTDGESPEGRMHVAPKRGRQIGRAHV